DQLLCDLLLTVGELLRDGAEGGGQLGVLALLRQFLGPVHGQVEVAAAVVDRAELALGGFALVQKRLGGAVERIGQHSGARVVGGAGEAAQRLGQGQELAEELQRRSASSTSCWTCLGAEPPAPVSNRPPPFISGTTDSILALVPSSMIGNRSVR